MCNTHTHTHTHTHTYPQGVDEAYDDALEGLEAVERQLQDHLKEVREGGL